MGARGGLRCQGLAGSFPLWTNVETRRVCGHLKFSFVMTLKESMSTVFLFFTLFRTSGTTLFPSQFPLRTSSCHEEVDDPAASKVRQLPVHRQNLVEREDEETILVWEVKPASGIEHDLCLDPLGWLVSLLGDVRRRPDGANSVTNAMFFGIVSRHGG